MRKRYFAQAGVFMRYYGIDIEPEATRLIGAEGQVFIGDQHDPNFIGWVASQLPPLDIVNDDGSHYAAGQIIAFEAFFPLLQSGGVYMVEDLAWPTWDGRM